MRFSERIAALLSRLVSMVPTQPIGAGVLVPVTPPPARPPKRSGRPVERA